MKKIILFFFIVLLSLKGFSQKVENGPNFKDIDSIEKAIELYENGQLSKIYMMPLEFGGEDIPENIIYAPEFVLKFKKQFDKIVEDLLLDGKKLNFEAIPKYKGKSFIPSKLMLEVTGDSELTKTINIW